MKPKTLNDLIEEDKEEVNNLSTGNYEGLKYFQGRLDLINELKAEAIKWVKEDKEITKRLHVDDVATWGISIRRWMKRLNITEEDLQ